MKITKRQLKRIIAEGQSRFGHVVRTSTGIFGRPMQIDEESDGNLVIVADEAEVEKHYSELMSVFPHGQMTEDGFVTGVYEDMSRAPFRESKMKITKKQLRRIIREEKQKLLRESFADAVNQGRAQSRAREEAEFGSTTHGSEQYLGALANLTYAADKALESLNLASRDIGPSDKALYDKLDEAMAVMEDLMGLANQAYEEGSEES